MDLKISFCKSSDFRIVLRIASESLQNWSVICGVEIRGPLSSCRMTYSLNRILSKAVVAYRVEQLECNSIVNWLNTLCALGMQWIESYSKIRS